MLYNTNQSMKKHQKGILISFEGGEGGGKTTQLKFLTVELQKKGLSVVDIREPGGTLISEQIREVVLQPSNTKMAFTTEVLLFQAARAQVYQELVIPALKEGKVVLCDRTRDSSVIYQGVVRNFGQKIIENLNNISTQQTYPDVTFLLDVPVEIGLRRRMQTGEINRLDLEQKEFHEKVQQAYLKLAKKNDRKRWIIIDASQPFATVHKEILAHLTKRGLFDSKFCEEKDTSFN